MRITFVFILSLCVFAASGQKTTGNNHRDSLLAVQKKLLFNYDSIRNASSLDSITGVLKRAQAESDSIRKASGLDSLANLITKIEKQISPGQSKRKSCPDYTALTIIGGEQLADFSTFNRGLRNLGYKEIGEDFANMMIGFSKKHNRLLYTTGIRPRTISESFNTDVRFKIYGGGFDFGVGYALIDHPDFQLYPQVSLGTQRFNIEVIREDATTTIVDVNTLVANDGNTHLRKTNLILNYGFEADYGGISDGRNAGFILGLQGGFASNLYNDNFRLSRRSTLFDISDDTIRLWYVGFMIKVLFRN